MADCTNCTNQLTALSDTPVQPCPAVGFQPATVCVLVTVTPSVKTLPTTTFCCGDPIITPGAKVCEGKVNGSCTFTISQNICVAVPVEFSATATTSAPSVLCGDATGEDICTNCGMEG